MPKIFDQYDKRGSQRVLRLKKTIYGLRRIPRYFWRYLTHKLIVGGIIQSNLDPFLLVGDKVICIVHVDNLILHDL